MTVTGSGFVAGQTTVTFDDVPATFVNVQGEGQLTLSTPTGTPGLADIVVTTHGGSSAPAPLYTYFAPPTTTAIDPPNGPLAGIGVTVTGTNFDGLTSIAIEMPDGTFESVAAADVSVGGGGTTATFDMPASAEPGEAAVSVVTPGNPSNPVTFTYLPIPTATAISPDSGPLSGGAIARVTINGTGFVDGETTVEFDGTPATNIVLGNNGTSVFADPPAHAAGAINVVVATPGGEAAPLTYTYVTAPTATSLTPEAGPVSGGPAGSVAIIGTNFIPGETTVLFDDIPATNVVVAADGLSLSADSPAHAAGEVDVVVVTPGGETAPLPYEYVDPPTALSIDPTVGPSVGRDRRDDHRHQLHPR